MKQKLIVSSKNLLVALKTIKPAIAKNTIFPTLDCVFIEVKGSAAYLTGSNLETFIATKIPCEADSEFLALLSVYQLMKLTENLPSASMAFDFDTVNNKVLISCAGATFEMQTDEVGNYPKFPTMGEVLTTKELTKRFVEDCAIALNFVSGDSLRPAMTGVYFDYGGNKLRLAATDAHSLFASDYYDGISPRSFIVPSAGMKIIASIAWQTISRSDKKKLSGIL